MLSPIFQEQENKQKTMKAIFKILFINLLSFSIQAQEYCFVNNGLKTQETVSFEIKGTTVKFGTWESSNYEKNTNAETYLFYGTKQGNKLKITFTRTVPYTLPTNAKAAIWTLDNGVLMIPMNQKNYQTNKFENFINEFTNCEAIKSDDFEENLTQDIPCSCDAYVIDKDKNGLNVREKGDKNAAIVAKIPFNSEGTLVHIKSSNTAGWLKVSKATNLNDKPVINKEGFVFAQKLGISVSGFKTGKVDIYTNPDIKSKVVHSIISGNDVIILGCKGKWLKIKDLQTNTSGWLKAEDQCANPVTACN